MNAPMQAYEFSAEVCVPPKMHLVTDARDHKLWAKRLKARHDAGEALSVIQRNAYMEALV